MIILKIVAFVPIKLNNQRLPGKNLLPMDGRPVCDYLLSTLNGIDSIDEKYVYCSDESIRDYLPTNIRYLKRDARLDGFNVRGLEIIEAFVKDVDADIYVLTHVTNPFMKAESIEKAIEMVKSGSYDSAFSAKRIQGYCWYKGKPMNYVLSELVQTQYLEPVYRETGAFFIFKKEVFTQLHQRIGQKPYVHEVDEFEGVDLDTREDFEFACIVARHLNEMYKG